MIKKSFLTKKDVDKLARDMLLWFDQEDNLLVCDFMLKRGFSKPDYPHLEKKSAAFKRAMIQAREIERTRLVLGGLVGKFNQSFASFVLKSILGYDEADTPKEPAPYDEFKNMSDEALLKKAREIAKNILEEDYGNEC